MHATTTFAAIIAAFWCTVSASPVAQNSAPLTLWNGESDMHGMYTSQPIERRSAFAQPDPENLTLWNGERDVQTNHTSSPDLHSRLAPLDVTDCSGSTLCSKLGGATGQCATASRLIDSGNTYSTTGNAGRTGVCSKSCGIFVSGTNCQMSGAQLLDAYNSMHSSGCADCGRVTLHVNGCQAKMDFVSFC